MRLMRTHLPRELLAFWLIEFFLGAALFYVMLTPSGDGAWLDISALNRAAILASALGLGGALLGLYRAENLLETRRLVSTTLIGGLIAFPVMLFCLFVANDGVRHWLLTDINAAVGLLAGWLTLLLATRFALNHALARGWLRHTVLIVGPPHEAAILAAAIEGQQPGFVRVGGVVPTSTLPALLAAPRRGRFGRSQPWGLVVTRAARAEIPLGALLARRDETPFLFGEGEFRESRLRRLDIDHLEPDWQLDADRIGRSRLGRIAHRALDLAGAVILLLIASPVMAATALAIRCEDGKPILYRQIRVGRDGAPFTVYKFRSMRVDAEKRGAVWASERDPRVTRVGAVIRRLRIDELPQLFNVLAGDMALVGPRPERPEFIDDLAARIPHYAERLLVKPGITGWAQVRAPYAASIEEARTKLSYDLYYIKNRSLLFDLLILAATIRVVLFREGAR